jgi:hypothetical protein
MTQPPIEPDDERVSRKVVYETSASSGSSRQMTGTVIAILVIAIALVVFILMRMH